MRHAGGSGTPLTIRPVTKRPPDRQKKAAPAPRQELSVYALLKPKLLFAEWALLLLCASLVLCGVLAVPVFPLGLLLFLLIDLLLLFPRYAERKLRQSKESDPVREIVAWDDGVCWNERGKTKTARFAGRLSALKKEGTLLLLDQKNQLPPLTLTEGSFANTEEYNELLRRLRVAGILSEVRDDAPGKNFYERQR